MADGRAKDRESFDLREALTRLSEAERITAILEARLAQYQTTLENIRSIAGKALEG